MKENQKFFSFEIWESQRKSIPAIKFFILLRESPEIFNVLQFRDFNIATVSKLLQEFEKGKVMKLKDNNENIKELEDLKIKNFSNFYNFL